MTTRDWVDEYLALERQALAEDGDMAGAFGDLASDLWDALSPAEQTEARNRTRALWNKELEAAGRSFRWEAAP